MNEQGASLSQTLPVFRLLFKHDFETPGCIRVQLKTDSRNERSQRAIERIDAVKEGVLHGT